MTVQLLRFICSYLGQIYIFHAEKRGRWQYNMYSEESDMEEEAGGGPIVVEVTGTGNRHSPVSARRSPGLARGSVRRPVSGRGRRRTHREDISEY